jgi:isopenicillin-N epimerase
VFERYQAWQRELERNPVEFLQDRITGLLGAARARLAVHLGADEENLVFVPNATYGLNVAARAVQLQPGDEVLATDHEYGAAALMWEFVCRRANARYVRCAVPTPVTSVEELVDRLVAAVTPRTRVLFVSHITSPTALVLPLPELCRIGRDAGLLVVVDGAHAAGQIPLDLNGLGADVYAGNCHKWLCSPKGAGFLHVRPEHQRWIESLVVGWGWEEGEDFVRRNELQGTRDPSACLAVPDAIEFQESRDWDSVRLRCHELAWEARERLCELPGVEPLAAVPEWVAQMASVRLPPANAERIRRRLAEEHRVEVYVKEWEGRPALRVSLQGYNTKDDVDRLLEALPRVLRSLA